ncbi:flagellar M-ring protein FliF [Gordoniibacillus kamchatkensis]|uniref:Flagellar M-ring protein n=1 Tax=Gordoniibacillus kamchatkensis TaxID=1590651 RepID=A0ABR5AEJ8_9BACL|nr:flagellar basal-body MS-ring/collar protein FliF [Paenibacillus sp. VKM B-2647]KIL39248.1 flagellar M-ring protein FliF [Paenibacillus sp. VKM B-2647]
MNETVLQYWNNVKQYWDRFSKTQKWMFGATVLALLLVIGIITYNMSKTEYSLAFTDLQPNDAAAIKNYLDTAKIPYKLSPDGKSIGVPTSEVANVKIAVESQGLNKSGSIGYGAFQSNNMFGMSDQVFKVKYVEAMQGELQQLINANTAISGSKVLINMPDDPVFMTRNKEQASASVVLQVKPGYTLDQSKIDTIYNLVSHSVKNLPVDNITITNQDGEPMPYSRSAGGKSPTAALSSNMEINKQFQVDLQKTITNLLGTMLGKDKVIVSVFSTMNFDQQTSHQELVTAPNTIDQKGLEISLQEVQKSYTSDGGAATGGVPGTGSTDVPGYPGGSSGGKSNSDETTRTVNYEVNHIKNDIISTPYVVKDISINVGIEPPNPADPGSLTQATKDAVQASLVNIVRAALADNKQTYTNADLTSKVTVFAHTFARPTVANSPTTSWLTYGGIGLAALAIGAIGVYAVMRRKRQRQLEAELAAAAAEPAKVEYPTIDIDNVSGENQVRKQLETLAKRRPEDFVNLLRTWLVDD